jgi:hypothetical protein
VKQLTRLGHVIDVGRRADQRVHDARLGVHADVRLHAVMPLVALLRLVHLRVTLTAGILRRARRGNDGGVHDGAGAHEQTLLGKMGVDLLEQRLGQVVGDQQAAKLQQRGGIGHRLSRQVDAHEVPQRLAVVDRILEGFIGQAVPLLEQVHAKHLGNAHRLAADTRPLVGYSGSITAIKRAHGTTSLHVGEKLLAAGSLLLQSVLGAGKAALAHGCSWGCRGALRHAWGVPVLR